MIRISGHLGATVLSAFPALAPQHHGAHTVLTGLLDQSALYGVLAEIEALGLDLLEIRKLTRTAHHRNQVTAAHSDGHYSADLTGITIRTAAQKTGTRRSPAVERNA